MAALAGVLSVVAVAMLALGGGTPAAALRKATPEITIYRPPADLFGWRAIAYPPADDFAKWTGTLARYEAERRIERELCARGDCGLQRWREFLADLRGAEPRTQLRAVNDYFNRITYRTDLENYGADDYWATPRELFARGGDCEDYAIAKYLSLRALGWPVERLRVVVVHDRARDLVHAALVAYDAGEAYLLDIEIPAVTEHRRVGRYMPIFAISEGGWWSYNPVPDRGHPAGAARDKEAERLPQR